MESDWATEGKACENPNLSVSENVTRAIVESVSDADLATWDLWEIIPQITEHLSEDSLQKNSNLNSLSERAINKIATVTNPKEFVLIALSQFEENCDATKFCALLKPLGCAFLRLPDECGKSLQWCLGSIYEYLKKQLEPPDDCQLEGEKLILDSNSDYLIVCKVYEELFEFYRLIQAKILNSTEVGDENSQKLSKLKEIFSTHLIKILGRPLIHLDLEIKSGTSKSRIRSFVEGLIEIIFSVSSDVISYIKKTDISQNVNSTSDNSELIPILSAANFYYLIFCEISASGDKIPKVYSQSYVRFNLLPLATALVSCDESLIRRKGLLLSNFMFLKLDCNFSLEGTLIEPFMKGLITCITYEKVEDNRKLSFTVFKNYFCKLSIQEKYLMFLNLRAVLTNSSLTAHVITTIKDTMIQNYKHPLFSRKYLFDLIDLYCKLPDGATTDLMASANEIIAALNLIRFLVIRDKSNELGVFKYLGKLREILLDPLAEALKTSREQWHSKLGEINEGTVECDKVSLIVSGQRLPKMPKKEQIGVVNSAFNCIDLLESLSARVNECISELSIDS